LAQNHSHIIKFEAITKIK